MRSCPPSPPEAARELLARRRGRSALADFVAYTSPDYRAEPAHLLLARTLDRVVAGETPRLMVFAPPQHGKSRLCSVELPAYWLGRRPDDPVILTSYAASLAEDFSREARSKFDSPDFRALFPGVALRPDARTLAKWHVAGRGGYLLAAGVRGPVMGRGARLGIIDDPYESWADAHSPTVRRRVLEWYRGVFRSRLWEGAAVVLVMSRWHPEDLAGRLLAEQGDEWAVLRLPAVAESQADRDRSHRLLGLPPGLPDPLGRPAGAPLCPGRFSAAALAAIRRDVGPLAWPGQYQGVPHEGEGNVYQRGWFRRFEDRGDHFVLQTGERVLRKDCTVFVSADPAGGVSDEADRTAAGAFALTPTNDLLWLDCLCDRLPLEVIPPALERFCRGRGAEYLVVESVFLQRSIARQLKERRGMAGCPVREFDPGGKSKLVRAVPAITKASRGEVYLPDPARADWVEPLLEELAAFTGLDDAHDDRVDCLSMAVATAGRFASGRGAAPVPLPGGRGRR